MPIECKEECIELGYCPHYANPPCIIATAPDPHEQKRRKKKRQG